MQKRILGEDIANRTAAQTAREETARLRSQIEEFDRACKLLKGQKAAQ